MDDDVPDPLGELSKLVPSPAITNLEVKKVLGESGVTNFDERVLQQIVTRIEC